MRSSFYTMALSKITTYAPLSPLSVIPNKIFILNLLVLCNKQTDDVFKIANADWKKAQFMMTYVEEVEFKG